MFFFVSGINTKTKELGNATNMICPSCGALTHMHVTLLYESLHLFFIPVIKWNRRYLVTAPCCGTVFELDPQEGKAFQTGEKNSVDPAHLHKASGFFTPPGICPYCGAPLSSGAKFCSQCGRPVR